MMVNMNNGTTASRTPLRTLLIAGLAGAVGMGTYAGTTGLSLASQPGGTVHEAPLEADANGVVPFTAADKGTCLTWNMDDNGVISDFQETDCNNEHRFEVSSREDLNTYPTSEFGPDAPPPNQTRQAQLREELCQTASIRYLGGRYDPSGRYSIAPILPPTDAWENGDRTMLCGLQETNAEGVPILTTGKAAERDQARVYETGSCLITDQANNLTTVDCTEPHHIEVTGKVDLAPVFADHTPSVDEQNKYLGDVCAKAAEDYVGSEENLYQTTLQIYWGTSPTRAWDGGSRTVNCGLMFAKDNRFATLTGSAKNGREALTVDGAVPEAPPERRPLRSEQGGPDGAAGAEDPVPVAPQPYNEP